MIAKPLPGTGVRVFQRMDALIAEREDRLVLVQQISGIWIAWQVFGVHYEAAQRCVRPA
jgi:hypothetical protein